jgi:hypothetical protein
MSFGNSEGWHIPEEKALPVLKEAYDKGINTWDTVQTQAHPPTHSSHYTNNPLGRRLLLRRVRTHSRQSPKGIQHPARTRGNPIQMLRRTPEPRRHGRAIRYRKDVCYDRQ